MLIRVQLPIQQSATRVAHFTQSSGNLSTPSFTGAVALADEKNKTEEKIIQAPDSE
jgi:hypothetical protein